MLPSPEDPRMMFEGCQWGKLSGGASTVSRRPTLLAAEDNGDSPLVVVVNETGARTIWCGETAVGKRIAMPWSDTLNAEIVGVLADVHHDGRTSRRPRRS